MRYAVASIVTAAQRADADRLMWALGYQPDPATGASTYSVPLSPTGAEPATHYGCNAQAADVVFADTLAGRKMPVSTELGRRGLTAKRAADAAAALTAEQLDTRSFAWPALLARLGLKRIEVLE